jgi:hypothetical protein
MTGSLNLKPITRAAVCSILVAARLAGAEWFPTQPAAGRETEQQIFRPGLRNSFAGAGLSAEELDMALARLRSKTGFKRMRFDEAGFLTIDDRSQIASGSGTARELLLAAVDGKRSINLRSRNRSPEVVFARVGKRMNYESRRSGKRIEMAPIEVDFADFDHLRGEREVLEAFDLGFAILHELCHVALELRDPSEGTQGAGDCESYVNRIRRELGMPERQHYVANVYQGRSAYSLAGIIAEVIFAHTKPGMKTKRLFLTWDVREVGNPHLPQERIGIH